MTANEEELFRAEALHAFSERHYGRPIAFIPKLWPILGLTVFLMVGVAVAFLLTATYGERPVNPTLRGVILGR